MCPNCPTCGLHFEREIRGYWLGAYTVNLMVTEAAFAASFLAALVATWPEPPWDRIMYGSIGLMVGFPFLFFPFSKTLYLAVDLTFRPAEAQDFEAPQEAGLNSQRRRA
jgi:hypothetical protein